MSTYTLEKISEMSIALASADLKLFKKYSAKESRPKIKNIGCIVSGNISIYRKYWKVSRAYFNFLKFFCGFTFKLHLLKRDDLSAYLEVNKFLSISPLFQTSFALLFGHYIE